MDRRRKATGQVAQSQRFIRMAREVEANESPDALDRAFERVVKPAKIAYPKSKK